MRELIFYVAKQFSIVFYTFWPLPLVTRGRYVDTHTREGGDRRTDGEPEPERVRLHLELESNRTRARDTREAGRERGTERGETGVGV